MHPFDCALRRGDLRGFMPATFPQGLGNDFAGTGRPISPISPLVA